MNWAEPSVYSPAINPNSFRTHRTDIYSLVIQPAQLVVLSPVGFSSPLASDSHTTSAGTAKQPFPADGAFSISRLSSKPSTISWTVLLGAHSINSSVLRS